VTYRLTEEDLRKAFDPQVLNRGRGVRVHKRVRQVDASADGLRIAGSVQGSERRPYNQTVSLVPVRGGTGVRVSGYCTCPVGINCKHVAAVLLEHCSRLKHVEAASPDPRADGHVAAAAQATRLSADVTAWIDRLGEAIAPTAKAQSEHTPNQRELRFVLNPRDALPRGASAAAALIRAVSVRLKKDRSIFDERRCDPNIASRPATQLPQFVAVDDLPILRDLAVLGNTHRLTGGADLPLGADAVSLRCLEAMLATGRLRLGSADGPVLRPGPDMPAEPRWVKGERGGQRLAFAPTAEAGGIDAVLPLRPPWYVDAERGLIGRIATALPVALALEVARAPEIGLSQAAAVKSLLTQRLRKSNDGNTAADGDADGVPVAAIALPLPEAPANVETRDAVKPVPRLELYMDEVALQPSHLWYAEEAGHEGVFRLPLARLAFDYAGDVVRHDAPAPVLERTEGDKLILTPRDRAAEDAARKLLGKLGLVALSATPLKADRENAGALFVPPQESHTPYQFIAACDEPSRFIAFSIEALPKLVERGWQVVYAEGYPYRVAEGEAGWWADVGEGSGIDWFAFELGVEFEGHRINLVPHLLGLLDRLPREVLAGAGTDEASDAFAKLCATLKLYHPLPDGRLLPLPGERLAPILKSLIQLVGPRSDRLVDGKVKLHRAEAGALAAFADATDKSGLAWAASAGRLLEFGQRLKGGVSVARLAPPPSFKAALRPYQADGMSWLGFLREAQFGGVLADDMGLGKTVQALAFLAHEKAEGRLDKPALIVSPTSVLPNWQAEAERFAPNLSVLPLRGLDRKQLFDQIPRHDLVLTTYPLLARDHEVLLGHEFHAAILDEAQAIKNPKATISGLAHRLNARHRLALTGTPLENNLGEVWSLFEFLSPGLLGDESTFRRTFRTPIEKHGDRVAQTFLSRRLKPFMLRRTKEEVATELPPKTEIVEHVRLEGAQRDLYETVRVLMHAKVRAEIDSKGLARSHIVFLDALLKLRQICCDPRLLKLPQARKVKGSAKLERLTEMLPELIAEGRRVLLFSQFTSMLALIQEELARLKIPHVILTGDTKDRAMPVREFQSGKVPLFLLSLKAGGTGLNLTAADTVIHYDPWWNPAVESQATDRAYRIGQDKPVFVYKLIVEEGIEAAIEQLKARKAALAQALFDGASKTPLDLSEADISALFAPLRSEPVRRAA
jgi:superfamily II DNA or RNA helicase